MTALAVTPVPLTVCAGGLCVERCEHRPIDRLQVLVCREWIREYARHRTTFNAKMFVQSYALKHAVETWSQGRGVTWLQVDHDGRRWAGPRLYVPQGAFIRAALLEGYQAEPLHAGRAVARFTMGFARFPRGAA